MSNWSLTRSSCSFSLSTIGLFPECGLALAAASPLSGRVVDSPRAAQSLSHPYSSCKQLLYWLGALTHNATLVHSDSQDSW